MAAWRPFYVGGHANVKAAGQDTALMDNPDHMGDCPLHGHQRVVLVRGCWRFVCCGKREKQAEERPT
jgi:hypothetical protein